MRSLPRVLVAVLLGAVVALAAPPRPAAAQGGERILAFDSRIEVHPDASMTVVETIKIRSEQDKFKRGIYRDFPTTYKGRHGERVTVGFQLLEVLRNGRPEPYHVEPRANGVRIYVGEHDVFIPAGEHVYTLTYRTDRQLGFFADYDELYWNVTGNDWAFTIDRASARVVLPEGAAVVEWAAYTGRTGGQGRQYARTAAGEAAFAVETTRPLEPGEGLTIAVAWPKGFVAQPTLQDEAGYFLRDNAAFAAGLVGLAVLLVYFVAVWARVGRDPAKGAIVPEYDPPDGVSPAAARYLAEMGYDDRVLTAAVVNLAVKGFLRIEEAEAGKYTLHKIDKGPRLTAGEAALAGKLFPGGVATTELVPSNHKRLSEARKALRASLKGDYERTYFLRNTAYFVPGLVITVFAFALMALLSREPAGTGFISLWLAVWSTGCYVLALRVVAAWRAAGAAGSALQAGGALFSTLFALPFFGGLLFGLWYLAESLSLPAALALGAIVLVDIGFYDLLKAPTRLGRKIMDRIEGFKLYLSVAEKDRLNFHNPPQRTPALFERYLPYALALGVEQAWSEQFADVLAAASQAPGGSGGGYRPGWYSGSGFRTGDLGGLAGSIGSGLSGAIAASSVAPGSSSGSGGGGSSGGGGGGGGGGSW